MSLFQNKYRIDSTRLAGWDYSSNAPYFVTICTENRIHHFGRIIDDKMHLFELGLAADDCWKKIPEHFPFTELGEHVVMPNHVHGIIIINKTPQLVETQNFASLHKSGNKFGPQSQNLASIVRGFKIGVTKYATQNSIHFKWQPRFHDHIIRTKEEFEKIHNYIVANPQNWEKDKFYTIQP